MAEITAVGRRATRCRQPRPLWGLAPALAGLVGAGAVKGIAKGSSAAARGRNLQHRVRACLSSAGTDGACADQLDLAESKMEYLFQQAGN
jgi:hypothetical protein